MSTDMWLEKHIDACDHCGRGPDDLRTGDYNITWNVSAIVEACLASAFTRLNLKNDLDFRHLPAKPNYSWNRLKGMTGAQCLPIVREALVEANNPDRRPEFVAMEPSNGWGSLDGSVKATLIGLISECERYPTWTIRMDS